MTFLSLTLIPPRSRFHRLPLPALTHTPIFYPFSLPHLTFHTFMVTCAIDYVHKYIEPAAVGWRSIDSSFTIQSTRFPHLHLFVGFAYMCTYAAVRFTYITYLYPPPPNSPKHTHKTSKTCTPTTPPNTSIHLALEWHPGPAVFVEGKELGTILSLMNQKLYISYLLFESNCFYFSYICDLMKYFHFRTRFMSFCTPRFF